MSTLTLGYIAVALAGFILGIMVPGFMLWKKQRDFIQLRENNTQLKHAIEDKQKAFSILFSQSGLGVALMNLDGKIFDANSTFCEILGYNHEDMLTHNFFYLVQPNHLHDLHANIQLMIDKQSMTYQSEQQCFKRNGESVWVMVTVSLVSDIEDHPAYFILQLQNISLLKIAEERLQHTSYHDSLTSLPNRNKFEQDLLHFIAMSQRHDHTFGVMFIDLDRFKNINETLGRESGDHLLQVIAQRITKSVRNTDLVARLGDDEFVIILSDVKRTETVAMIAEKVLNNVFQPIVINGKEVYITASIGISLYPADGNNLPQLMRNADAALYRAKDYGRNNYQFYAAEVTAKAREKLNLQKALSNALVKNEFNLNYQPIMELGTRQIIGIEALIRWKNKEYGIITPSEIVSLTEETGLIIPVSEWVINAACTQLHAWQDMGYKKLTISINCSDRQFKQATFVDDIMNIITQAGIEPDSLEIEVTESLIMHDPENTLRILYALKDLGFRIVIDDFGTGYWSWSNLRRINVDKIKIDKLFIKQIGADDSVSRLVTAMIAMINSLGIISVAEGVETREQYDFLFKAGCKQIQGYYLSQPLSHEELTRFLKHPIPDAEMTTKMETVT